MRYFKYKNANKNINNALKEQYKILIEDENRTIRKEKIWRRISSIVATGFFFLCLAVGIDMIILIPIPNWWLWEALVIVGKVILFFPLLLIDGLATWIITIPLWKKVESFHLPSMKKEILSKACGYLRDYYGLQEPYIVTKCFDATDEKFKNRDVCIFVLKDEIRITVDIIRGFLHEERDLGCYAFRQDEISLSKQQEGKHLIVKLEVDDTVFLLGYRAKGFIEKSFNAKESK